MRETLVKFIIGEGGGTVPERVRQAIKHQQENSEKLIAWVQLSVVATFGALYALSPKTAAGNPWLTPVSLALLFYLLFTLLRMRLAYRYRLAGWFLDLSVILDIVLLMVLIWSFHLQYGQPASFSLKAPTLLYVFIFIALRALRFEPRYVVMCGLTAAAGWTLLVLYTVTISYPDTMITRDYVTYLTSNSVLLGAEFDKIITILLVTGIIAVALMRARRLLERAVGEAAAASDLSRFFSPEIASQIVQSEQLIRAGEGQARNAAILTVDIRDFTGLSNGMPASALITLLADYESRIVPVIERHGGTVDKFLGDGILASFGAALPSETYAADALRAADAVIGAAADWNAARAAAGAIPVRIGVAVASGRVIFGAVGADSRLEFTCIGEPVNRSAKLEKHNRAAASLAMTDAATYALACDQGYAPATAPERLAEASVAGLGGAVDLVVLAR
ncbi:MAG: adenylate/guanylate cyclase domain-containing protein [Alphaproteobacteria bacterium]|nr:adenylate/guanylate cyclase domain-containing protein [Alphaproteobacteria bacterium]